MFDALTQSDLAAIRDLAIERSRLAPSSSPSTTDAMRDARTVLLAERIQRLPATALSELAALVRLGADGAGVSWERLVREESLTMPTQLASRPALDELIERGLLKLHARQGGADG